MASNNNKKGKNQEAIAQNPDMSQVDQKAEDLNKIIEKQITPYADLLKELLREQREDSLKREKALLETLERIVSQNKPNEPKKEEEFKNYTNAYHNFAQSNVSKKEGFVTEVKVDKNYQKKLNELLGK
jgi:hypothetical protein